MSIEETYKGMWSSDATLLKSLLDAGETIIAVSGMGYGRAFFYDCDYVFQVGDDLYYIEKRMNELLFLIPPRPLVLEPKPLEWIKPKWHKHEGLCYFEAGKDKAWRVTVWGSDRTGYEITVHYRRAYSVASRKVEWFSRYELVDVQKEAEQMFEEIKSSING